MNGEYLSLETAKAINNLKKQLEEEKNAYNQIYNRNQKAIDFLKENACIDEDIEYFCDDLRYDDCKKLLEILKGGDKE